MLQAPLKKVTLFVKLISNIENITLSKCQILFLGQLITGMILLGSFKVTALSVLFLSGPSVAAIYAMLRRGKIPFDRLFLGSVKLVIKIFNVHIVTLQIDDTERERSKNSRFLPFLRKTFCKATGGWVQAQNLVFIVLVTDKITIPIWFSFHRPLNLSKKEKDACKGNTAKIKKLDPTYETKIDLACKGLDAVAERLNQISQELEIRLKVKCVSGDNGYASTQIQAKVSELFDCAYISKANPNQKVKTKTGYLPLEGFFKRISAVCKTIEIRGKQVSLEFKAARVFVHAYGRKVFVVAIRYSGDKSWQYLFCTDLTWCAESIIKGYGLRWLVEVFFEDWKQCDGWGSGALQRSDDRAVRGVFLSLLVDLFLLYDQRTCKRLQEHGRGQLYSAGTVVRHLQVEACYEAIKTILDHDNPRAELERIREQMSDVAERHVSLKHAKAFDLDELGPSLSLSQRYGRTNREQEEQQRVALNNEGLKALAS